MTIDRCKIFNFIKLRNLARVLWAWRCEDSRCQKFKLTPENNATAIGLTLCRHQCSEESIGTLWPKPSGVTAVSKNVIKIDPEKISFKTNSFKKEPEMWKMAEVRFNDMIVRKLGRKYLSKSGGEEVVIEVIAETDDMGEKII